MNSAADSLGVAKADSNIQQRHLHWFVHCPLPLHFSTPAYFPDQGFFSVLFCLLLFGVYLLGGEVKNTVKASNHQIFSYVYSISDFCQLDIAGLPVLKQNSINVLPDLPITLFLKPALFVYFQHITKFQWKSLGHFTFSQSQLSWRQNALLCCSSEMCLHDTAEYNDIWSWKLETATASVLSVTAGSSTEGRAKIDHVTPTYCT